MDLLAVIGIVLFFYIKNKPFRGQKGGRGNDTASNTKAGTGIPRSSSGENPYGQPHRNRSVKSVMQSAGSLAKTVSARQDTQSAIREAKKDGHSTTAYLMEKAQADAREHEKDKYEEQMRLYETRGRLPVAKRYLDGDSIPKQERLISCGYCGAENLVPAAARTGYSCYFCREPL